MTTHFQRRARGGVSALETALLFPLLLWMLFAVIDWSWALTHWLTVTRAAQAGVRLAAGVETAEDPAGVAEAAARAWMDSYGLNGGAAGVTALLAGDTITVEIELPLEPLIGLVPLPDDLVGRAEASWYGSVYDPT